MNFLPNIFAFMLIAIASFSIIDITCQNEVIDERSSYDKDQNENNSLKTPVQNPSQTSPPEPIDEGNLDTPPNRPAPKRPENQGNAPGEISVNENSTIPVRPAPPSRPAPPRPDQSKSNADAASKINEQFKNTLTELTAKNDPLSKTDLGKDALSLIASLSLFDTKTQDVATSTSIIDEQLKKLNQRLLSLNNPEGRSAQDRTTIFETLKTLSDSLADFKKTLPSTRNDLIKKFPDFIKDINIQASSLSNLEVNVAVLSESYLDKSQSITRELSNKLSEVSKEILDEVAKDFFKVSVRVNYRLSTVRSFFKNIVKQIYNEAETTFSKPFWSVTPKAKGDTLNSLQGITKNLSTTSGNVETLSEKLGTNTPTGYAAIIAELQQLNSRAVESEKTWQGISISEK